MPFLTRAQIVVLLHKKRLLDQVRADLVASCRAFSDGRLHSQACVVGGMHAGACNGVSGTTPCPCGAEDPPVPTVAEAYKELGADPLDVLVRAAKEVWPPPVEEHRRLLDQAVAVQERVHLERTVPSELDRWEMRQRGADDQARGQASGPWSGPDAAELNAREREAGAKLPTITGTFGADSLASLLGTEASIPGHVPFLPVPRCAGCEDDPCPHAATCVRGGRRPPGF